MNEWDEIEALIEETGAGLPKDREPARNGDETAAQDAALTAEILDTLDELSLGVLRG